MAGPVITTSGGTTGTLAPELARDAKDIRAATAAEQNKAFAENQVHEKRLAGVAKNESTLADELKFNLGAAAAGAASGATFGLSDQALTSYGGDEMRRTLQEYRDESPGIHGAAQLGGAIAGLAVGAGEVGGAIRGVRGLAAAEEALQATRLGRMALGAAKAGAEGAALGAGDVISESALGNEKLTAEKLIAGMGHSAAIGGGLGALFGGLGGRAAAKGAEYSELAAEGAAGRAGQIAAEDSGIAGAARKLSDQKLVKSLGATPTELRRLSEKYAPGEFEEIVRSRVKASGQSEFFNTPEKMHDLATRELETTGKKLGDMYEHLDSAGVPKPAFSEIQESIQKQLIEPNMIRSAEAAREVPGLSGLGAVKPANEATAAFKPYAEQDLAKVFEAVEQAQKLGENSTFRDWNEFRIKIDKRAKWAAQNAPEAVENLQKLRGIIEDNIIAKAEAGANGIGESFAQEYRANKAIYSAFKDVENFTERRVARNLGNNTIGLRPFIGAAGALASGHPVGGLAALIGGQLMNHSDMFVSAVADRAASLLGVQRVVTRADAAIAKGAQALVKGAPKDAARSILDIPPARELPRAALVASAIEGMSAVKRRSSYDKLADSIRTADPQQTAARLGESLQNLAPHAPGVAAETASTAVRGLTFLQSKLPASSADPFSPTPQFGKPNRMTSDVDISKFLRYAEAVDDPISVMTLISKGKGTRQHVEAIKEVYPLLYSQMQGDVTRRLMDAKRPLSFDERLKLGTFYDMPTMRAMTPEFQKTLQGTFSPTQSEPGAVASGGPTIDIASNTMTSTDKAAYR